MSLLRILAFGELTDEAWGVGWMTDGSAPPRLAVRVGATAAVFEVNLEPADDGVWRLIGDGLSLVITPTLAALASGNASGEFERRDQLCEVGGHVRIEARETEIGCLGWRSSLRAGAELDQFDSVRFLAAWLEPRAGFSLTAVRPRRARGQEADLVAAVVAEEPPPQVIDPRLSTTYSDQGVPTRAGLELWLEPEAHEDTAEEAPLQYPRRAAGEAAGAGLGWEAGDISLHASLLRWHSHGLEGPGVYVLGRRA